jgi:hypothetical protein
MPDISMCDNNDCPSRLGCYRFMAEPNPYRQAYMEFKFDERGKCDHFAPNWTSKTTDLTIKTKEE